MQLYAITNSRTLATGLEGRIEALCRFAANWARGGVDYLQIREKDLTAGELERLTAAIVREVEGSQIKILVNGRPDVALATGANGIHLPGGPQLAPSEFRRLFARRRHPEISISVSCHSLEEAKAAKEAGATQVLFAPVFEKTIAEGQLPGRGLDALSRVCQAVSPLPVFALGGVNKENAGECMAAGAAGIAGIRLFAGEEWSLLRN